jgi:hypothetical protein
MKKIFIIAALALLFLGSIALVWHQMERQDPHRNGKRISQWIKECGNIDINASAHEVATRQIRELGVDAMPVFLKMFRYTSDNTISGDDFVLELRVQLHNGGGIGNPRFAAAYAFQYLAPETQNSFLPHLDQLLNEPATSDGAAIALSFMNSNAVPVFTNALNNKDITVKQRAVKGLGMMHAQAETAVPVLLNLLKENSSMENIVIEALGKVGSMPDLVVPQLIKRLYRPPADPADGKPLELNTLVVKALAGFGTNAMPAVPEILKALPMQDGYTRNAVTNALKLIDPASLQK